MIYLSKFFLYYLEFVEQLILKDVFVGEDVCFFSEYEVLENELGKVFLFYENGQIDWLKILENSEVLFCV